MKQRMVRRVAAVLASLSLLAGGLLSAGPWVVAENTENTTAGSVAAGAYEAYISSNATYPTGTEALVADMAGAVVKSGTAVWQSDKGAWETAENSEMVFSIQVPEAGLYHLSADYMTSDTTGAEILRTVYVNDELPYDEARGMLLRRLYQDGERSKDSVGNDIRPSQLEVQVRQSVLLRDYMGYITEPLMFYLKAGENKITLVADSAPCFLYGIAAVPAKAEVVYSPNPAGEKTDAEPLLIQGEDASLKTSPTLYPSSDRVTVDTQPSSPSLQLLNVIGGSNWSQPNQSIIWDFEVKTTGYYTLTFKTRQSITRGLVSSRDIYLDGEMPYAGMKNWSVSFDPDWQYLTLQDADGQPLRFYLEAGTHRLEIATALGDKAEKISTINEQLEKLNNVYTRLMMVMGSSPDIYRDYKLETLIPEVLAELPQIAGEIEAVRDWYLEYYKVNTSNNAILDTIIRQLYKFDEDSEDIAKGFAAFKSNIASLADWVVSARSQPLEVDYFVLEPVGGQPMEHKTATWWDSVKFATSRFIYSFVSDYSVIGGEVSQDAITVWIPTGRDQAQVLKKLIDSSFTPEKDIAVNLNLVAAGTLMSATVAGRGPDVALSNGDGDAVNFGMRSAVYNLSSFEDFEEVTKRFLPQRMTPYYYQDACYALPETQSFPVMFYRKDVLDMLGLTVPTTWTELTNTITVLMKNNMGFAMPVGAGAYYWLLYQQGGALYAGNGTKTIIDSHEGVAAFRFWTNLYKNYELPVSYNFLARFRTGEYPLIIEDFINANTLSISAPEIRGLWGFAPIPGVERADGTLDNSVTVGGNCTLMMKDTDQPEKAWEFMKWWTDTQTQVTYGREMESILGASARYNSANLSAFQQTAWTTEQKTVLTEQLMQSRGIPQVPGGYFMDRHLNNAFRKVIYQDGDPQDVIYDYVYTINQEIASKREEFGLEVEN